MPSISSIFASDGKLAKHIKGFVPRGEQTEMAEAVKRALDNNQRLIVEAGTGTGKTYAYLIPALLGDGKAIVSTGTKNLQEQLYHRDLPIVKKALASNKKTALLKGRANYLCHHRLRQHGGNSTLVDREVLGQLTVVRQWAETTKTGDMGELKTLPEDAKVLPMVTSTVDNCLGRDCPDYEECYLVQARRKALEADVIVVNHHLFFADLALKDTGFGELIPEAESIIFDEAHQIPDIATDYFGESVSTRQIQEICKDIRLVYRTALKDIEQLDKAAEKCRLIAADLRLMFPLDPQRGHWIEALEDEKISTEVTKLAEALDVLQTVCKLHIGRDKDLDNLYERVIQCRERLDAMLDIKQDNVSLWYETTPKHLILHLTPLSIAAKFRHIVSSPPRGWIFTSATLMVNGGFEHFQRRMGLEDAKTLGLDSPFDYPSQAMLCVPRYLPEPNSRELKATLLDTAETLIKASKGRCFLLFTSHAMLNELAEKLAERVDNPLLVQGSTTKQALLQSYLDDQNAVLLGTGAFWEGVDVRGSDLICVMIDKLPFASPDDPLLQARMDDCKKRGANPFAAIQIPQAVITLKQGAGRLIRDPQDKGVLVICDNRLVTKPYAKTFLGSLPDMARTRSLDKVTEFLASIE